MSKAVRSEYHIAWNTAVQRQIEIHQSQHGARINGTWLPVMSRCVDPWCKEAFRLMVSNP